MEMTIHTFELTAILSVEETEKLRNTLFDYAKGKQGMCYKNGNRLYFNRWCSDGIRFFLHRNTNIPGSTLHLVITPAKILGYDDAAALFFPSLQNMDKIDAAIREILSLLPIKLHSQQMQLNRLDLCRNVLLPEQRYIDTYIHLLKKGAFAARWEKQSYPDGDERNAHSFRMVNTYYQVAIYCRLSEEDRNKKQETDDSNSIQNQKAMLLEYSIQQGWEVYNIYSDDNYTGSDRNRPEFKRLLDDAEAHKFDIVLCKSQSRFTRELELVEKYINGLFPIWGIHFISLVDNADTANKGNKKSRQINGLVNEWYLEDMSENIRAVLTNRRKNGFHIGAFALYGYQKDPEQKGHLIIDEEAAAIVREVFTLFSQGYGKTAIARMLNERGVPNPTEYKRQHGLRYQQPKRRNSTLWKYFAISDMLTNEIYIGNMVQGKYGSVSYKTKQNKPRPKDNWYRVEGTHEAIIDRDLWDLVQSIIAARAKPFDVGTVGLFARKVRCANCGYTMRSSKNRGKHYLQCSNRHVAKDACIGSFIAVDKLEKIVIQELNNLSQRYLDQDELERSVEFKQNLEQQKEACLKAKAKLQKQLEDNSNYLLALYKDKVKGLVSEKDYFTMANDFSKERERTEYQIKEADRHLEELEAQMLAGDQRKEIIQRYTHVEHLTREMVEILIDYITVGKRVPGTQDVPIEIHWNF